MKYLLCFLLVCSLQIASGQNCKATYLGEVKDFHDATSLYGATVHLKELNKYTSTDTSGKFKFENLCEGVYTFVVSHIGCETQEIQAEIKGDAFGVIHLEHHSEELGEVTVQGKSGAKKTLTAQETVLKKEVLESYSSATLGDALKEVSGVSTISTGSAIVKPVINGLHSSRIAIINNGVRLQDQEWGIEHAPNIDINAVDHVTVIKGAGALAYGGDAIGGVVILDPSKVIRKDSLYGKSILSGQSNGRGGSFTNSLTKTYENGWFISGQGTYKQLGDFEAPDYMLSNTGVQTQAFTFSTGYKKFEKGFDVYYSYIDNALGILRASHTGSARDLLNAINSPVPLIENDFTYDIDNPKQEITHNLLKSSFYKRFENLGKFTLQYDYQYNQRFEYDRRRAARKDIPAVDLVLQTHSVMSDFKFDANKNKIFQVGVLARYQDNFANPDTGVRRLIPDYQKVDVGGYMTYLFKLNDKLTLDAALRYDFNRIDAKKFYQISRWEERGYDDDFSDLIIKEVASQYLVNPKLNYHNFSASAGVLYTINKKSKGSFNYTLANRAPNPSELFSDGLHHSSARIEIGDLRIKQEHSHRFSTSYSFEGNKLSTQLDLYANFIDGFVFFEPVEPLATNRGIFPVWDYKQTNALLMGVDINLNYHFHENWSITNKSAFIKGDDLEQNEPLIDIPAFNSITGLTFKKESWLGLTAALKSEFVGKQNRYPENIVSVYMPETDSYEDLDLGATPNKYHLLHLESSIKINQKGKMPIQLGCSVNNLLDTSYRDYLNRLRFFGDNMGRNIIFSIKINY